MKMRVLLMGMLALLPLAEASATTTYRQITLEQAIVRVLEGSPRLQSADFEARAAAERIQQARLAAPYRLGIELENVVGTGVAGGGDVMESTLSLARVLEFAAKPDLRAGVARQEARLLRDEQDARRLDVLADTARHFLAVVADQERRVVASDTLELAQRVRQAVERRVRAGKTPAVERRRAAIEFTRSELELNKTEHELVVSRRNLAAMWGDRQPDFSAAQADLFVLGPVGPFGELERLLERNPDLVQLATQQRLSEARLQLAEAGRRADIEVSGGARYLSGTDDMALVLSASMPLGTAARARPAIDVARLTGQGQLFDYEQRSLELHATLFEIHQNLSHAKTVVETLRDRIIPDAEAALHDYEKGFSAGRYSLLELTDAQSELLQARLDYVTAASEYHRYRIEIDRLTGAVMPAGVSP